MKIEAITEAERQILHALQILDAAWQQDVELRTARISEAYSLLERAGHKLGAEHDRLMRKAAQPR